MESVLMWADYLILAAFLLISLAIGLYHSLTGGRQKTTSEFIMANRRLHVIPTSISLLVSFQSAILILGFTAEMYAYGAQMMLLSGLCFIVNTVFVATIFVPWLYPLKLVSINEYIYRRFGSHAVRIYASLLGILTSVLYMGSAMYAPSAALESVTGLPLTLSIPLMAVVCMAYTALGGMRAVIWTDVFQFLTMIGGMLAVLIQGIIVVGGIGNVFKYAEDEGRMVLVDWSPDPTVRHTFWNIMVGGAIGWIPAYGLSQAAVQRYSATMSMSKARLTIFLNIPGVVLIEFLAGLLGCVVFSYYAKIQCDPLANKEIYNANQLLPHYVLKLFSDIPGFAGLFLATLYGGALSSVSSALSGCAANLWEDVLQWKLMHLRETTKAIINRMLVIVFGVLATAMAFFAAAMPGPITQVSTALCGAAVGPLFGVFMLGGISRLANWKGTLIGGIVSLIFNAWLTFGGLSVPHGHPPFPPVSTDGCVSPDNSTFSITDFHRNLTTSYFFSSQTTQESTPLPELSSLEKFYSISYLWYTFTGLVVALVVGMIASLPFRDRELEKAVDERLLIRYIGCFSIGKHEEEDDESIEKVKLEANNEAVMAKVQEKEVIVTSI